MLPLLILAPLAGLLILNLPLRGVTRAMLAAVGLVLALAQIVLAWLTPEVLLEKTELWSGFVLGFAFDDLTRVMLVAIGMVLSAAILVAHATLDDDRAQRNFMNLVLVIMLGMNGTVLLADLFSLYLFVEVTSVTSFVMIALHRGREAIEGAFKYLILSAVAAALMLLSIAFFLLTVGATDFQSVRAAMAPGATLSRIAVAVFLCGLFIKAGLVPFHGWLPAAYSTAPAGASVVLAGIATKVSGVYALIRLVHFVFADDPRINQVLLVVGTLSILVGAFAALGQTDLKRMLAYSSISQVGYIVLAVGGATELAMAGAVFHLFNHALFKTLLFSNSAAVESRLGTTDMTRMGGLGARMPITGFTSAVALLSTAGIPPFSGFWSKLIIVVALWQAGHQAYAVIAVLASVLTLAYFLVMERTAFFGKTSPALSEVREAAPVLVAPAVALALVTVVIGALFPFLSDSFLLLGGRLW